MNNYPGKFKLIGFEKDVEIYNRALSRNSDDVEIFNMSYSKIAQYLQDKNPGSVTGLLFDLGINSAHLDDPDRGFSYLKPGPLDLRFDRSDGQPVHELIADMKDNEIWTMLFEYGQERKSKAIARKIYAEKPATTQSLAEIIRKVVGDRGFIKSASRIFQALRIFVNDELNVLASTLQNLIPMLSAGGRIAVISYHSLEDRLVKRNFQLYSGKCFCGPNIIECECGSSKLLNVLTKKPLRPSDDETRLNSKARPARLRYAEKT